MPQDFIWIDYACPCPNCGKTIIGFQSKDHLENFKGGEPENPAIVENFYTYCAKCLYWIEFRKIRRDLGEHWNSASVWEVEYFYMRDDGGRTSAFINIWSVGWKLNKMDLKILSTAAPPPEPSDAQETVSGVASGELNV